MYKNIYDPKSNKKYSLNSKKGMNILNKYYKKYIMLGGATKGSSKKGKSVPELKRDLKKALLIIEKSALKYANRPNINKGIMHLFNSRKVNSLVLSTIHLETSHYDITRWKDEIPVFTDMPFIVQKALNIAIPLIMIKNIKRTAKTDYGASPFVIKNPEKSSATGWSLSSERCISYLLKKARKNADSSRSASRPAPRLASPRPAPRLASPRPAPRLASPRPAPHPAPHPASPRSGVHDGEWLGPSSFDLRGDFSPLPSDLDSDYGDLDGFF